MTHFGCIFVCVVPSENGKLPFPGISELNARLRRIVAAFQKSHKRELLKQEQNEKVCTLNGLSFCVYVDHVFCFLTSVLATSENSNQSRRLSLQRVGRSDLF